VTVAHTPDPPASLISDLAEAMLNATAVHKSQHNKDQNYDYASAEQILAAVRGPLLERGLVLTQRTVGLNVYEIVSKGGAKGTGVIVEIEFTFHHGPTGDTLVIPGWRGSAQDYGDKAIQKAYTNAVKTFIRSQWLLPTDTENTDTPLPDAAPSEPAPPWARQARPERRDELAARLVALGVDPDVLLGSIEETIGHIPDIVVSFARALPAGHAAQTPPQPAAGRPPARPAAGDPFHRNDPGYDPPDEPEDGAPDVHPDQGALV